MIILIEFQLKNSRNYTIYKPTKNGAKIPFVMSDEKRSLSIYIHIPFCRKRCGYCDFNTYAGMDHLLNEYVDSVIKEITYFSSIYSDEHIVKTIYFGGGTPTILPIKLFRKLLSEIETDFQVADDVEISTEANPFGLTIAFLSELLDAGINRLSIGMQSAVENELRILDRLQRLEDVQESIWNAQTAGFENINLDLIFGIPTQTLASFKDSVHEATKLAPTHLSIYGLALGDTTPLAKKIQTGRIPVIDEDLAGEMYEWVMDDLPVLGFNQYEISNWAQTSEKSDHRCVHNIQYWHNKDYLGLGAGAHSFIEENRWNTLYSIPDYISGIWNEQPKSGIKHRAIADWNHLGKDDIIKETMMMGLRLTEEGVNPIEFTKRFGIGLDAVYHKQIKNLIALGLLEYAVYQNSEVLRLTRKGRSIGNQVFLEFV